MLYKNVLKIVWHQKICDKYHKKRKDHHNGLLYKNNIIYAWAKFIQDSKMTKRLMVIYFKNLDLAPI